VSTASILLWERLLVIGLAGAAGAIARYTLSRAIMLMTGGSFPWGTMAVNILGCLLFGLILGLCDHKAMFNDRTRLMLLVGFLGAFTTFSTYAYESVVLLREHHWWVAAVNIIVQNVVGLLAFMSGFAISRW